jgi:L-2-hydroxyglutarate oxidase LhgO
MGRADRLQRRSRRAQRFYAAIRRYWPACRRTRSRRICGIRPKISGPGEPAADFVIQGRRARRRGLVHLFGIESPGLTASLALADDVARLLSE